MKQESQFILILAQSDDRTAIRVCAGLRKRWARERVRIITPEALALAGHVHYRMGDKLDMNGADFEFRLAGGAVLNPETIGVVFNRLRFASAPHFTASSQADREYALSELTAFWLSWLSSLDCPVVNLPSGRSLYGPGFSRLEWLKLASSVGLPVCGGEFNSLAMDIGALQGGNMVCIAQRNGRGSCSHFVAGDFTISPPGSTFLDHAGELNRKIRLLQDRSGCRLFRVDTVVEDAASGAASLSPADLCGWVVNIDPFPIASTPAEVQVVEKMLEAYFVAALAKSSAR